MLRVLCSVIWRDNKNMKLVSTAVSSSGEHGRQVVGAK